MESLNDFKATELRLGLPGRDEAHDHQKIVSTNKNKRTLSGQLVNESESTSNFDAKKVDNEATPPSKVQVVGWPPVRSYRKNSFKKTEAGTSNGMYIKVSMDGAPYLRKIDLTLYKGYPELLKAVENMFKLDIGEYTEREGYKGSEYAPAYEDKDGDLMLVGDVPWDMFTSSCKKLRIIKGSDAKGLAFGV